ncbi:unnamed protein product [Prunus armeniaca]
MGPFSLLSHANPCVWVPGTGSSSRAPSDLKLTFLEPSMGLVIARSPPCHNLLSKPRGDSAEFLVGVKLVILLNFCIGGQLGHLCLIATRCRTRTGFGSSFKVEFGSGGNRHTSISGGEYLPLSNIQGIGGSILPMLSHGLVPLAIFLCVGVLYDRHKTRLVRYYRGSVSTMLKRKGSVALDYLSRTLVGAE